jgi:hypothetical protein
MMGLWRLLLGTIRIGYHLRYALGLAMLLGTFWGYRSVRSELSDHQQALRALAAEAVAQCGGELLAALPQRSAEALLYVAPLAGDEDAQLHHALREYLHRAGISLASRGGLASWVRAWSDPAPPADDGQAAAEGRAVGARYVVYGRLPQRPLTLAGQQRLTAELVLLDAHAAQRLRQATVDVPGGATSVRPSPEMAAGLTFAWGRFALWGGMVLVLPLALSRPLAGVLRRRSNRANAALVLAFATLTLTSGWLLWVGPAAGLWRWLALAAGSGVLVTYFGWICGHVQEAWT